MAHVMVLDDEPNICWAFRSFLKDDGHRVTTASTAEQAIRSVEADPPDVIFADVCLPGADGLVALERFRLLCPEAAVVIMTAHGTVQTAVRAVKGGAFEYLAKPFDLDTARGLVRRALAARDAGPSTPAAIPPGGTILGSSAALQGVFRQVALAAFSDEPVLITGESGTGKELVARAIHQHGERSAGPFVAVHLAAIPEGLVERELFGHERGAFTGADSARPGLFDRAAGGTIFFDEVAEAPTAIQAKLLRVLDSGEYRSVGGGPDRRLGARVVAATNRDLAAWARTGAFRADLFYRLAVLPIALPPLRERLDDLPTLWDAFLDRAGVPHRPPLDPTSPIGRALFAHDWPGNVRELRNVAEQASRSGGGLSPELEHLPPLGLPRVEAQGTSPPLDGAVALWARAAFAEAGPERGDLWDRFLAEVERPLLREAIRWAAGNQAKLARRLGLHRTTLRQKLRLHGLDGSTAEPGPSE